LKRRIIFRVFPFNRLSYPILLNSWEKEELDTEFDIIITDKIIKAKSGDIWLYSFMTPFLPIIHKEIKKINNNEIIIVGGGPHINGELELSFEIGFDILFVGNSEKSFLQFGTDLLNGKVKKERKIYNQIPYDFNNYLPISKYFKTLPPLEITRGCFWNCKYCQTNINKPRYRDIESIKEYFKYSVSKGFKRINFISPSALEFGSDKIGKTSLTNIIELLNTAKKERFEFIEYGIFPSEIRPDSIDEDGIKVIKQFVSNKRITIGAQSGDDKRLRSLNRGHLIKDIENAVQIINKFDFIANLDFIIGYPDETEEEINRTFSFIEYLYKNHRVKIQFHYFFPLSGSKLQNRLPTKISDKSRRKLLDMNKNGIGKSGWVQNEIDGNNFFKWLENNFPSVYNNYH